MGYTNKISSVIKGRINSGTNAVKGFVDGLAGDISSQIDNFSNQFTGAENTEATKAKARQILNQSPLEIGEGGAMQGRVRSRISFGQIYYPEETGMLDEGHYVIFDIIENRKTSYGSSMKRKVEVPADDDAEATRVAAAGGSAPGGGYATDYYGSTTRKAREMSSGIGQGGSHTHTRISDTVCLYTPAEAAKFSYKANYENLATGLAGLMASSMEAGKDMSFKEALVDGGGAMIERVLGEAVTSIASALPGVGDVRGAIDKSMGRALNPFNEQVFRSVPFREFAFPFTFAPKNKKEMLNVEKIIKLFKFHMLPEFSNKTKSAFLSPSEFQITYYYRGKTNDYIPQISRCVMTGMDVDYATEGTFHTFREDDRGAAPITTTMTCTFAETEIMTKETIAKGY
tara:strand:- start:3088 stop:4287 length:1200 start_codon:yes stop_codon:yes gene_type:complete